ncbi:holo-ACP synthase [Shivajiella indica]|uniref:Holo-ACP synthase n=1 Tax=Shivajiella indica TaxID=872115 RepID=A0ABW5B8P9_9BACT
MRVFIGNDIENVSRFNNLLINKPQLLKRIFFEQEYAYALKSKNPDQSFTGIWCAKEAVLKAFTPFIILEPRQIEIIKNPKGYPEAIIHHPEISSINYHLSISISHTREIATAIALLQII